MAMTATQLGRLLGLGAAATNLLLRDHGFLEGHPGDWQATERGKPFAHALGDGNDYGGYAARSWSWLAWSDDIVPALKASMKANPDGVPAAAALPTVATSSGASSRGRNALVAAATVGVVAVAVPTAKRAWTTKVLPAASRVRARVTRTRQDDGSPEPHATSEQDHQLD